MKLDLGIVILAAGEGTRLKLNVPKALAPLKSRVLIDYVIDAAKKFAQNSNLKAATTVITGHRREEVEAHVKEHHSDVGFCFQEVRRGTGDAIKAYFKGCEFAALPRYTLVLCADTPMISERELGELYETLVNSKAEAICASFVAANPFGYGRIKRGTKGFSIVEQKDASIEEEQINEVNSGLYIFQTELLRRGVEGLGNQNKSGEFYLTDVFSADANVKAHSFSQEDIFRGINTLAQLAQMEEQLNDLLIERLLEGGVRLTHRSSLIVDPQVEVAAGVTIGAYVELRGQTKIATGAVLESHIVLQNAQIENGAKIHSYSYLEDCVVHEKAGIGPYTRLRPGADIGASSKIGNFVEIKKSVLHEGVKVSHLSYVGDAEVGRNTNIGCGFITCNYDGKNKHKTEIGSDCFIGSDSQMVAPIKVGDGSFVASGSTINQDMPAGSFAISRAKQVTKEGMAGRFLKK